jgi:hypothetical protein
MTIIAIIREWLKAIYVAFLTYFYFNDQSVSNNKLFIIFMLAIIFSIAIGIAEFVLLNTTKNLYKNMIIAREMQHVI